MSNDELQMPNDELLNPEIKTEDTGRRTQDAGRPNHGLIFSLKFLAVVILIAGTAATAMILDVQFRYIGKLYRSPADIQTAPIAIVLGASVKLNGDPSPALRDRLSVGLSLYQQGLVQDLLITGDDGQYHINEIKTMREFLVSAGVPADHILEDGHGYRTYESCKRAVETFGIKKAIVVTQRFHIGRALYLCNQLGIDAAGVTSDLTNYERAVFFTLRDIAASVQAWWDVNIHSPNPPVEY